MRVFRVLVSDKKILFDEADNGIMICFTQGWIQRDLNPFLDQDYCIFPTPLHEMYVEYQYFQVCIPFPYRYVLHTIRGLYSSGAQIFASEPLERTKWLPTRTCWLFAAEGSSFQTRILPHIH